MTHPFLNPDYPLDLNGGAIIRGRDVTLRPHPASPPPQPSSGRNTVIPVGAFSIDEILEHGTVKTGQIADALEAAMEYATPEGIVLTMPELVLAKITSATETKKGKKTTYDTSHRFWQNYHDVTTEEYLGTTPQGNEVVIVRHGTLLLPPPRIREAYEAGLVNGAAPLNADEWKTLLDSPLLTYDDLKQNPPSALRGYSLILDKDKAIQYASGDLTEQDFLNSQLAIARCGGEQYAQDYFKRANRGGKLRCSHPFANADFTKPQGRLLFLDDDGSGGLGSDYGLNGDLGRFVGVAPEARRAR